jgi:outer membrane protein assembly factor BamB
LPDLPPTVTSQPWGASAPSASAGPAAVEAPAAPTAPRAAPPRAAPQPAAPQRPAPAADTPHAEPSAEEAVETAKAADKKAPGRVLWVWPKQIPGQPYSTAPVRCCPALFGKTQFAACFGKELIAFDWKNSGLEVLWRYDCVGHVPGSPVLGNDGLIRVHSGDGWLHCVGQDGCREWDPVPVGEPLGWAAPVVDSDGNAYISAYSGGLLKVTARGNFKNTPFLRTRQKFDSTGLIYQNVLYVGCEDAFLWAIELGENAGRSLWDQLENRGRTDWFINSAPAVTPDSVIVVAGRDENLYGFHRDGQLAWKVYIPGQMLAHPVVGSNGDIYVGVSVVKVNQKDRGRLVCIDGASHRVRWEYDAKGAVESTPVIGDDDVLYFGDNAGHIHALRPDGHCLWSTYVRVAVRSAGMIVGPNRLVFGMDNGTMVGLLCSSGGVSRKGWGKYMAKFR